MFIFSLAHANELMLLLKKEPNTVLNTMMKTLLSYETNKLWYLPNKLWYLPENNTVYVFNTTVLTSNIEGRSIGLKITTYITNYIGLSYI